MPEQPLPQPGQRNAFIYWAGHDYSLITLLRRIMVRHADEGRNYVLHHVTPENARRYLDDLPECFDTLCPVQQADVVRVLLVCRYGGLWLDSDTLVMDGLGGLFDLLRDGRGFFVTEEKTRLCSGIFGSQPRTPLMEAWRRFVLDTMQAKGAGIEWGEIGFQYLTRVAGDPVLLRDYTILDGLATVYPVDWHRCVHQFVLRPFDTWHEHEREFQPAIVLVNAVYKLLEPLTTDEILRSRFPLNHFLDRSLGDGRLPATVASSPAAARVAPRDDRSAA
jgi:hypothetical protein